MKRLRFVHVVWLVLVAVAGLTGLLSGAGGGAILLGVVSAAVPGVIGAALLTPDWRGQIIDTFLVIGWTVFATMGLALTGGAASPMTVLFVIGPLVAFGMGQRERAAEAAVFAVIAYVAVATMDGFGLLGAPGAGAAALGGAFAFGGLIISALLVWILFQNVEAALARETGADDSANDNAAVADGQAGAATGVTLPEGCGILLLDVAPEGRIRSHSGDTLGLSALKPGKLLADIFMHGDEAVRKLGGKTAWTAEGVFSTGREVAVMGEPYDNGTRLLVRDLSDMRAEAGEVAGALEEMEGKLAARTEFFASLGHDLKTPLNAILGYSDMMRSEIRGPLPEAYADYPEIIHESGQDLLLLVEDILDLAKAEADRHRLEIEPVDLSASGQSVMRQLKNQAERAGVTLKQKNDDEVWAAADARAVRQIWQNLVSNAIKYSDRDSKVVLQAREENNAAVLTVIDTGAGMSKEDLARATEPFAQGDNARGRKGTGLGLAVVKRFAELHGGMLDIQTAPGKGTKVEVSLPLADMRGIEPLEEAAE